ncbi:hypothetical protein EST38_g4422 [Candolleomyces aberdarensis]|uniref:YDG domain-containing protein n=1 Tax=Candolleomyces aberdarensis TaxID=2316362 RepID=A0A4Q2DQE4_9AGAR|nr:hypothetical protein EST38_g4422 [Candolleomyces aberdarensis]
MAMERWYVASPHIFEARDRYLTTTTNRRKQLSQSAAYLSESNMLTSEANPTGRSGPIPGYPVGSTFSSRAACSKARVHGPTFAGIHGSKAYGAYSICLSGGYEDNVDEGDFM